MFDIGFSELMVIAVVALIVIGPQRLPTVARTLGHLLGRMQRYVNEVKADISREMELDELKKMQSSVEDAARSMRDSVTREVSEAEGELNKLAQSAQPGADPPRQWTWDLSDLLSRVRPVVEGVGYALWDWLPFSGWASDRSIPFKQALLALIVVVVVALTVLAFLRLRSGLPRTWHSDPSVLLGLLLGTFALAYFGQLTFTYLFSLPALDPSDIDQRILAPILVAIGLFLFVLAELLMRSATSRRWLAIVPSGLLLLYAAWFLPQAWNIASSLHQAGAGYTSQSWRTSPTIAALQALPTQTPIITNESAAVMLWLDRPAYDFKLPAADQPGSALDRFGDGADELASIFREQGAALVLFNSISAQLAGSYGEEGAGTRLAALTQGLELFARLDDGQVFFYPIEGQSE